MVCLEVLQFLRKPLTFEENLLAVIYLFSGYAVFAVNWKETRAFSFRQTASKTANLT